MFILASTQTKAKAHIAKRATQGNVYQCQKRDSLHYALPVQPSLVVRQTIFHQTAILPYPAWFSSSSSSPPFLAYPSHLRQKKRTLFTNAQQQEHLTRMHTSTQEQPTEQRTYFSFPTKAAHQNIYTRIFSITSSSPLFLLYDHQWIHILRRSLYPTFRKCWVYRLHSYHHENLFIYNVFICSLYEIHAAFFR